MRVGYLLAAISFAVFSSIGCKNATVEQPALPLATATPVIEKDQNGNYINPAGWTLPVTKAAKTEKSTWIEKYQDGRTVKVSVESYPTPLDPDQMVIFDGPSRAGGQALVITHVDELSVNNGRVFCFIYSISPFEDEGRGAEMSTMARSRFCDMDDDGKYELKGNLFGRTIIVPDWAK